MGRVVRRGDGRRWEGLSLVGEVEERVQRILGGRSRVGRGHPGQAEERSNDLAPSLPAEATGRHSLVLAGEQRVVVVAALVLQTFVSAALALLGLLRGLGARSVVVGDARGQQTVRDHADAQVEGVDLLLQLLQRRLDLDQRRGVVEARVLGLEGFLEVLQLLADLRQLVGLLVDDLVDPRALLLQLLQLVLDLLEREGEVSTIRTRTRTRTRPD